MQVMKKENLLTWIYSQLMKIQQIICPVIRAKSRSIATMLLKLLKSLKIFWLLEILLKMIMNKNKISNNRSKKIKKKMKKEKKKKKKRKRKKLNT